MRYLRRFKKPSGELVGAAREGRLALSVGVGLRVVHELMEAEVTEVVAEPKRSLGDDTGALRRFLPIGGFVLAGVIWFMVVAGWLGDLR